MSDQLWMIMFIVLVVVGCFMVQMTLYFAVFGIVMGVWLFYLITKEI